MTIYRSHEGKRILERCYDDATAQLSVDIEDRQIETRCGRTHVLLAGPSDGHPIFVLHGGNATNPMTLAWYTDLADSYRLIAPDIIGQPGYSVETRPDPAGDDYGEWVLDLMNAFDLDSAPMIGTSYGAGIILRTAALAPDRIDRAALVVPAGFGTGSLLSLFRIIVPGVVFRIYPRDWLLERVLSVLVTQSDPDPVVRATIGASLRHVSPVHTFPTASPSELRSLSAPVAVYLGEHDPLFPAHKIGPRVRKRIPSLAQIETLPGERHILSPAAQKRVSASIRAFLDG